MARSSSEAQELSAHGGSGAWLLSPEPGSGFSCALFRHAPQEFALIRYIPQPASCPGLAYLRAQRCPATAASKLMLQGRLSGEAALTCEQDCSQPNPWAAMARSQACLFVNRPLNCENGRVGTTVVPPQNVSNIGQRRNLVVAGR